MPNSSKFLLSLPLFLQQETPGNSWSGGCHSCQHSCETSGGVCDEQKEVEEYSVVFTEHSNKLVEVANLACSMSANEDGVKMVRYAAQQIQNLCPQVMYCYWPA